jgi:hypothetical protein
VYVAADIVDSDYTFGATPPSQLGNADTALTSLLDTYGAKTSSPYYLTSSTDISAASSAGECLHYQWLGPCLCLCQAGAQRLSPWQATLVIMPHRVPKRTRPMSP